MSVAVGSGIDGLVGVVVGVEVASGVIVEFIMTETKVAVMVEVETVEVSVLV